MNAHSPAWDTFFADAKSVDMLEVAARLGVKLKRSGADYSGACPAGCASDDGFVITPRKSAFICRPSGEGGDVISMVVHAHDCSNVEAIEFITGRDRPAGGKEETPEERDARETTKRKRDAANAARAKRAEKAEEARRRSDDEMVADVLARALPIGGTHAEAYLRARGLRPAKRLTGDLRFVADLDYWGAPSDTEDGKRLLAELPAMVGIIRDVAGAVIGIHQTYLDPVEPRKWAPTGARSNKAKKIRGEAKGGLIRLGMLGESLGLAEGLETAMSWHSLGMGPEDVSLASAISLGNLAGRWTGTINHKTRTDPKTGKPTKVPNGIPDMAAPGAILPDDVREVIIIGDGDSELIATQGAIATAARRWMAEGRRVSVHVAPEKYDFNSLIQAHAQ